MSLDKAIFERIDDLLGQGNTLTLNASRGAARTDTHQAECQGWIAACMNLLDLVCPDANAAYRREAQRIADSERSQGALAPMSVGALSALLKGLRADMANGLLASLADKARAQIFDDFLDHAQAYQKENRKNEASVIAGVVFEDLLRRICKKLGIEENGVKLDLLISEMVKRGTLSELKAKRARAAAGLRTSATHARWEEIGDGDVQPVIDLTRELIETHLDK